MPASRATRRRLSTAFTPVVALSLFASGCAGEDPSGLLALLRWAPGIVVIVRLGSKLGLMGGGFEIVCKMFFCTVVSLVAWMVAHGESPGLSVWPFVLTGVLVIPGLLSFLVLHVVLRRWWYLIAIATTVRGTNRREAGGADRREVTGPALDPEPPASGRRFRRSSPPPG